jgi:transposase
MAEHQRSVDWEAAYRTLQAAYEAQSQQLAQALATIERQAEQITQLEARLAKDSHNSAKPPASDGLGRRRRRVRPSSRKRSGGQCGHVGHTLALSEAPDVVVEHLPVTCVQCQASVAGLPGTVVERRQVHELPPPRLEVTEYQVKQGRCLTCRARSRGAFPTQVVAPVQYGPRVCAAAVYLHEYQLVPEERTTEALGDLFGCALSAGTLASWVAQASTGLAPTVAHIADLVAAGPHQHADETGIRIGGKLHWLHVNSTRWLTHLAWHRQRGQAATAAIGIWPRFRGWATHDRWANYNAYQSCRHRWCGAHLVRDLTFLAEEHHQQWAGVSRDLLLTMHIAVEEWRPQGASQVPLHEQAEWIAQYHEVLAQGQAAQADAGQESPRCVTGAGGAGAGLSDRPARALHEQPGRTGSAPGQGPAKDFGHLSSDDGATAYCRVRSYLSTMRKQGEGMLEALTAVFQGDPLPIAWGC